MILGKRGFPSFDCNFFLLLVSSRLALTANTAASRWWTSELGCSISPSTATSSSVLTVVTWTTTLSNPFLLTKFSKLIDECCLRTLATPLFVLVLFLTLLRKSWNSFWFYVRPFEFLVRFFFIYISTRV